MKCLNCWKSKANVQLCKFENVKIKDTSVFMYGIE